jgi:hypothetical protein
MGNITMNKKEREQLIVFEDLKNGEITQLEAALRKGKRCFLFPFFFKNSNVYCLRDEKKLLK